MLNKTIPSFITDKQQDVDIPTLKVEQTDPFKDIQEKNRPMSRITGVRKLEHANSFTGTVPKFGVETPHKENLSIVSILVLVLHYAIRISISPEIILKYYYIVFIINLL